MNLSNLVPEPIRNKLAAQLLRLPDATLRPLVASRLREVDGQVLEPQIALLLQMMDKLKIPTVDQMPLAEGRRSMVEQAGILSAPSNPMQQVETVHATTDVGVVPIRVYTPQQVPSLAPALVYYHGGGWVIGNLDSHDSVCRYLADKVKCVVFSVDYRLAPEHRFPAALDDSLAAYRWVQQQASAFAIDPKRVAVGGDSAGGNLAALVCQLLSAETLNQPCFQLLVYPATDATRSFASHHLFSSGYVLTESLMKWFLDQYLDGHDPKDPRISPLYCENFRGLPPATVVTAGFDPLRDEGKAYADKLREAQVPVSYRCHTGLIHSFLGMNGYVRAARIAVDAIVEDLKQAFSFSN
jgi:acetyl esterase